MPRRHATSPCTRCDPTIPVEIGVLPHQWPCLSAVTDCGGRSGFGSLPAWAEQRWPGIISGNFTQHGVNFDISSPGVPILMKAGIKEFFAKIGCHPALGGFILGNEVRLTALQPQPSRLGPFSACLVCR